MFIPIPWESKEISYVYTYVHSLKVTDTLKSKECKTRVIKRHFVLVFLAKFQYWQGKSNGEFISIVKTFEYQL